MEANSRFFAFLQTHKGTGSLHTEYRRGNESHTPFLIVACYHLKFFYHKKTHANCVLLKC